MCENDFALIALIFILLQNFTMPNLVQIKIHLIHSFCANFHHI